MSEELKAIDWLRAKTISYESRSEELHYALILYNLIINLQKENRELKKQLKIIQDGFTSSINDLCEYAIENERLKKQLSNSHQIKMKRLQQENRKLKQQLSNSHQIKNQQKEFIEWLEKNINHYKEIMGVNGN